MELYEKTISSETVFKGNIVELRVDRIELPDGRPARREVIAHPGGVAILPYHDDGTVTVVRQFRYPFGRVVTELPAGKLERGEDHRVCARRELEEETARLRQELAALQRGDTVKIADLFELYWDNNYNRLNPVLQRRYLDTFVLPYKPSPGDIDAYLTKLYTLRRINSDGDFQTLLAAKVAAVGRENLEKLLIYLDFDPFSRAFIMLGGGERKELLRTALGRSGRNSQLANLYSEIADASDADYILGMLEREPGFINAVKRLRLEKQALPVLKKRVMEAADGNRSFNYENEWLRSAVDAMPPDEQEAFIGSYWTKFQRSRNRSNNDWELRERAQLLSGFG